MKKIALVVALGVAGLVSGVANAGTATGNFNVNITLHSKCQLQNAAGTSWGGGILANYSEVRAGPVNTAQTLADSPTNAYPGQTLKDMDLVYTSFQTVEASAVTDFAVRCTNTLPYDVTISKTASNTADGGNSQMDSVLDLNYTLRLSDSITYSSTPNSFVTGSAGAGTTPKTFYVYGTIAADQSGTCNTSPTCTNGAAADRQRWVTIDF
jgi:hypothetical protein